MSKKKLTNLDYTDPAYWHDEPTTAITPAKRGEMVKPLPAPVVARRMEPPQNAMIVDAPQNATSHIEVRTSHKDRAIGFSISMAQLSAITALAIVVVRPFWSNNASFLEYATVAYFFGIYAGVYFIGYVLSNIVLTPEFAMLVTALGHLWLLRSEHKNRWQWHNRQNGE